MTCSSCKTVFTIGSTQPELTVEMCANCHPFYTGKEVLMDTEGRVEKFEKKRAAGEAGRKIKAAKKAAAEPQNDQKRPMSLKELLEQ